MSTTDPLERALSPLETERLARALDADHANRMEAEAEALTAEARGEAVLTKSAD